MTDRHDRTDDLLDGWFQTARANTPGLPAELTARIAADAAAHLPRQHAGLSALIAALGGWRPLAGMAAAGVAGMWIGAFPPDAVSDLTGALLGESVEVDFSDLYALADDTWFDGIEG